jgi:hypothetical protein
MYLCINQGLIGQIQFMTFAYMALEL